MATVIRGVVERIRSSAGGTGRMRGDGAVAVSLVVALVGGALSTLLLATGGGLWLATSKAADHVDRVTVFADLPDRPLRMVNGSVDVLIVATEQVKDATRLSYAVLAHVSRRHDSTTLVDLPPGSLVDVPEHRDTAGKEVAAGRLPLATAYAHGGPRLLVRAFEAASQVRLDGYAELSLTEVAGFVDELGGMRLCVPVAVDDRTAKLRLPPGPHDLTGAQTAAFLRSTSGSSLERVRHNQLLFGAVASRLFGAKAAFTPTANRHLLRAGADLVRVDEGFDLALARRLTLALRDPYGDRVAIVAVPVARTTRTATGTIMTWQAKLADYLFEKLRTDAELDPELVAPAPVPVAPSGVHVKVRNGTGIEGLAGDATDDLDGAGFTIRGKPDNASTRASATTVYYSKAYEEQAKTLQAAVPGSRLATMKPKTATLLLVLGADYAGIRNVVYAPDAPPDATEAADRITAAGPCG